MTIANSKLELSTDLAVRRSPHGGGRKRAFDILAASALLIVFMPMIFFIGIVMFSFDGGGILFSHRRIGYRGRRFNCLKFRSMVPDADAVLVRHLREDPAAMQEWQATHKLRNDPRVTRMGRFLRETSLDELPQLLNVLAGDMSLVGPRPIVEAEVSRYGAHFGHYVSARPGMTGLWQVSGRSDLDYARRVELDCTYVRNWSLSSDLMILIRTIKVVFTRVGSY